MAKHHDPEIDRKLRDWFIRSKCSDAVNQWLHRKGDGVFRYVNFIDRVGEISDLLREAIVEADAIDRSDMNIEEDGPDHYKITFHGKATRTYRSLFP